MTKKENKGLSCPTCGAPAATPVAPGRRSPRPFCSRRCADIDLGRWFQGNYVIPTVYSEEELIIETLVKSGELPLSED